MKFVTPCEWCMTWVILNSKNFDKERSSFKTAKICKITHFLTDRQSAEFFDTIYRQSPENKGNTPSNVLFLTTGETRIRLSRLLDRQPSIYGGMWIFFQSKFSTSPLTLLAGRKICPRLFQKKCFKYAIHTIMLKNCLRHLFTEG